MLMRAASNDVGQRIQLRTSALRSEEHGRLQADLIEAERRIKSWQKQIDREPDPNFEDPVVARALQMQYGDRGNLQQQLQEQQQHEHEHDVQLLKDENEEMLADLQCLTTTTTWMSPQ
jgi:hypothetical protein